MALTFVKLDINFFQNPKIQRINRMPGGDAYIKIYMALLTMAMKSHAPGLIMISENLAADPEDIAQYCGAKPEEVRSALKVFCKLNMVEISNDTVLIPSFDEHQSLSKIADSKERTRLRVKNYREKQRQLSCVTRTEPLRNANVTKSNAGDLDLDVQTKTEIKKEKEVADAPGAEAPSTSLLFDRLISIRKQTQTMPIPPARVPGKKPTYSRAHSELFGATARATLDAIEKADGVDLATEVFSFAARDQFWGKMPVVASKYDQYKAAYMAKVGNVETPAQVNERIGRELQEKWEAEKKEGKNGLIENW